MKPVNKNYAFIFSVLKSIETIQPVARMPFTFAAHGKDQNLRFDLMYGDRKCGVIDFAPVVEAEAGINALLLKTAQLLTDESVTELIGSIGKNRAKLRQTTIETFEGLVYGFKDKFAVSVANINNRREFILKGFLMDEGTIVGTLDLTLLLLEKTQFEELQDVFVTNRIKTLPAAVPNADGVIEPVF